MKVTFILPDAGNVPVGGVKIVYGYANGLVRRGHHVTVVHPAVLLKDTPTARRLRHLGKYLWRLLDGSHRSRTWIAMHPAVQLLWTPSAHPRYIPNADIVVATAWQTAEWVGHYPQAKGVQFYLIQGLETWAGSDERVRATWRLPIRKMVVSRWLQQIAHSIGQEAEYIPNGLDFEVYGIDIPSAERRASRILMLYHDAHWKGAADGLTALEKVRETVPDLELSLFGVSSAPSRLPSWIRYYRRPPTNVLRRLYNEAAIFVSASRTEGWGLTASEALMCGCALAVTDTGGHREFALHNETALLSPIQDPDTLADNVIRLIRDRELRLRLATAGHAYIQRFSWESALDSLEQTLTRALMTSDAFV